MDCKKPPTKEVLWAEGMGHAWFCDACFNIWRAKHKDDINSIKAIKDGEAVKKFSDNHNPNEVRVTERDLFNTLRVLPDLKDSKLF